MDRQLSRRQVVQSAGAVGLGLLAGCGRWPGQAQQTALGRVYRVGWLGQDRSGGEVRLREALRELGYLEGQNLVIERRWPEGQEDRLQALAAELAAIPVDVLLTSGVQTTEAARSVTSTIPIVMNYVGDPVAAGLVASLGRPESNVTGVTDLQFQLAPKRLELLKEAVLDIARVAVPQNPDRPSATIQPGGALHSAAQTLGVRLVPLPLRAPGDLDAALEAATQSGTDAVLWGGTGAAGGFRNSDYQTRIVGLAEQYRLPVMSGFLEWAYAGILLAYAANYGAQWAQAAVYIDKILKGTRPADLPVEQPMRFEFLVNLKTAQALGLTIPPHVLLQATEVIQ